MKHFGLKTSLIFNFALPALLLNCVGIIIFNLHQIYHVSAASAGWLEPFKDFSILIGSFLLVSYITKTGYKKAMLLGIVLQTIGCLLMALWPSLMMAKIYFIFIGVSFALIKIAVYSCVGLITQSDDQHASFLSLLEGFFMVGILAGYWIFPVFMKSSHWTYTFWLLAGLSVLGFLIALVTPIDESKLKKQHGEEEHVAKDYKRMMLLLIQIPVWLFLFLALNYLIIEQGVLNFLPMFNNKVLHILGTQSVIITSLFPASVAVGRIAFSFIVKRIHWSKALTVFIIIALVMLVISLFFIKQLSPNAQYAHWSQIPFVAYILSCIGFFIGPIYPTLSSSILSKQRLQDQSAMTVLIIIFSAIGGSIGGVAIGYGFDWFGGLNAFAMLCIPLIILAVLALPYHFILKRSKA